MVMASDRQIAVVRVAGWTGVLVGALYAWFRPMDALGTLVVILFASFCVRSAHLVWLLVRRAAAPRSGSKGIDTGQVVTVVAGTIVALVVLAFLVGVLAAPPGVAVVIVSLLVMIASEAVWRRSASD